MLGIEFNIGLYLYSRMRPIFRYLGNEGTDFFASLSASRKVRIIFDDFSASEHQSLLNTLIYPAIEDCDERTALLFLLFAAGTETSICAITLLLRIFTEYPQFHLELSKSKILRSVFVREAIRLESPLGITLRYASTSQELGSFRIERNMPIFVHLASANRDPLVFDKADQLSLTRKGTEPPPLTFGSGRHKCLGSALALAEMESVLEHLLLCPVMKRLQIRVEKGVSTPTFRKPKLLGNFENIALP